MTVWTRNESKELYSPSQHNTVSSILIIHLVYDEMDKSLCFGQRFFIINFVGAPILPPLESILYES